MKNLSKRGIMMITVLLLMPICVILGAIMLSNILSEKNFLSYERARGQSFYLAETGLSSAYYSFSGSTFTGFTHIKSDTETDPNEPGTKVTTDPLVISPLITARIPFVRVNGGDWDGWYEFTWTPASAYSSLTNTGQNESIHVRVSQTYSGSSFAGGRPKGWEIVSVAQLGQTIKTHRLSGDLEGITDNAIFDAGDLNEFLRGQNQNITGRVHANGDIYLKPSGTTLSINTDTPDGVAGFTTAGKFWWGVDATGRTNMGTVRVDNVGPITSADNWPSNLDSRSANWISQATALWGGTVADELLGANVKGVPPTKSFDPDGFYATTAMAGGICVHLDGSTTKVNNDVLGSGPLADAITAKTFYNNAELKTVDAVQIDMSKIDATEYANKLIYSEKPIVIINGQKLAQKTAIVSQSGIYTVGDFNKELATAADYDKKTNPANPQYNVNYTTKVSTSLMTKDRVWHLSKNYVFPTSQSGSAPAANDPEEYGTDNEYVNRERAGAPLGDNLDVIEVNALIMDGAPLHDETWNREVKTKDDGTQFLDKKWGPNNPDPANQATSWDDYLEAHGGSRVVKKRGSIVHLQNGEMAGISIFNQSNGNGTPLNQVAWYRRVFYDPPLRDYGYDIKLKTDPPPFAPFAANRTLWSRY